MVDWSVFDLDPDDYRFLLAKQETEYERVRNRASRVIQLVLSVISLTASFGVIQYLLAGGIDTAAWQISDRLANRCSPEALTHSGVTLRGIGALNSVIGFGIIVLIIILTYEMWRANSRLQNLPSLAPTSEAQLVGSNPVEWVRSNQKRIREANRLLEVITIRLRYVILFAGTAGLLFIAVYQDRAFLLLVVDPLLLLLGAVGIFMWGKDQFSGEGRNGWFGLETQRVSPVFLLWLVGVWGYGVLQYYKVLRLINYLLIC